MDKIVLGWCIDVIMGIRDASDVNGRDVLSYAACFCSTSTMHSILSSGIPIEPYALHWLIGQVAYCSRDVAFLQSVNERMDILLSTGKMRPTERILGETAMDIFRNIPPHMNEMMTQYGIHIDSSKLEPNLESLFHKLQL